MQKKKNKKILIIGSGNQAENYLKVFRKNKIKIDTICTTVNSYKKVIKLKEKYNIKKIGFNLINIIKKNNFDFIFIFITWNKIEKILTNILKYNNGTILTEKPIALSSQSLNKIIKIAKKNNREVYVLYNRRLFETINLIKKKIKNKRNYKFSINIPEHNNRILKKYGKKMKNKIRFFLSSHWLDLIFYICGKMKILKYFTNKSLASFVLKNKKCLGTINFYFNAVDNIRFNFYTKNFNLELYPLEKLYFSSSVKKKNYNYNLNKRLIMDISNQEFKPGIENLIKSIFIKKNFKKILPKISELRPIYSLLDKLKH